MMNKKYEPLEIHHPEALFTRDILTHNIAIKRYWDKKILRKKDIAIKRYCEKKTLR